MDTLTGGVGSQATMDDPDDPGMFRVSRESTDTLTGGVGSQASMDDPGIFRVSRESTDTLTGGLEARHPWMIQGCSESIQDTLTGGVGKPGNHG